MMDEIKRAADHIAAHDPILASVIAASPPLPDFQAHTNYYQALVNSIIGQQLSVKAAASIKERFSQLFQEPVPTPEHILEKSVDELRAVGLSRPKTNYIQDLARRVLDGSVQFDTINSLSNEEIVAELTKVKGIGEWTVHMFLIFCMGRLNVLPVGDLGVRTGIKNLYHLDYLPTPDEINAIAHDNHWRPYESVAVWYIWQSLNNKPSFDSQK
jgi:DNA-3-methyladenine glycosylase II